MLDVSRSLTCFRTSLMTHIQTAIIWYWHPEESLRFWEDMLCAQRALAQ
jgi:hypothetical protein